MKRTIEELAEEVYRRATAGNYLFKTVGLKVRFEDFETYTRAKSLTSYTDSKRIIIDNALTMLKEFEDKKKIRLLGVKVSALLKVEGTQKKLLAWMK